MHTQCSRNSLCLKERKQKRKMQHDRFILRKQHQRKKSSGEVSDAYRKIQRVKAKKYTNDLHCAFVPRLEVRWQKEKKLINVSWKNKNKTNGSVPTGISDLFVWNNEKGVNGAFRIIYSWNTGHAERTKCWLCLNEWEKWYKLHVYVQVMTVKY